MAKNWRINVVLALILLFGAAIICRLVSVQILNYELYKALAQGQQNDFKAVKGQRGQIFFSKGEILATNIEGRYVYASPEEVSNKEETAQRLSEILSLEREEIYEKLQKDSLFESIKDIITEEEESALEQANMAGVHVADAAARNYPHGIMASQIVGFVGGEGKGQYGIEGYYNDVLQGKEEFIKRSPDDNIDGSDIYLTIDYNLQYFAEKTLEQSKEDIDIKGGQIIVADPNTGRILAIADYPGFDPNSYYNSEDFDIFQNSAVQKLFEPGSTLKPVTMAAGLDLGRITPDTTYVDKGTLKISGYVIENYAGRVFGESTMTNVLEKSINTGAVFAQKQTGNSDFLRYLDKFSFFKPTGIDLQGETYSENRKLKNGYEIDFATAAFGQGIEITPIQLVRAFCAIANGGKLVKPYVADRIIGGGGQVTETSPEISDSIISSATVSKLTAMMVSVVENGYAKSAKIPGYYIAGKTGTAQVPWSALGESRKGYSEETWQSFIGFFPAFNPKFVVFIKLDNPKTNTAEYSAVPVFKKIANYIINYYSIPPDYE